MVTVRRQDREETVTVTICFPVHLYLALLLANKKQHNKKANCACEVADNTFVCIIWAVEIPCKG